MCPVIAITLLPTIEEPDDPTFQMAIGEYNSWSIKDAGAAFI